VYISTAPSWVYSGSSIPKENIASYAGRRVRVESVRSCRAR
jgi:hypothetical protein